MAILISIKELRKDFLNLKQQKTFSDDIKIEYLISKLDQDHIYLNSNNIYVYMGTHRQVYDNLTCNLAWHRFITNIVSENDPTAEYKCFYELNTGLPSYIKIEDGKLENFEQDNTIIYLPNLRHFESEYTFKQDFEKLRKSYFKELFINDEDEENIVSIITSEDYINQIFSFENYMKESKISSVFHRTFYENALCNNRNDSKFKVLNKTKKVIKY